MPWNGFPVASASGDLEKDKQMARYAERLEVRLSRDLKQQARQMAKREKQDLSDFVRIALMAAVRKYPGPTTEELKVFDKVRRDFHGAAQNLNQMVRLAYMSGYQNPSPPDIEKIQATAKNLTSFACDIADVIQLWL